MKVPESLCEKVVNQLLGKINDSNEHVRQAICLALGEIKMPESLCEKVVNQLLEEIDKADFKFLKTAHDPMQKVLLVYYEKLSFFERITFIIKLEAWQERYATSDRKVCLLLSSAIQAYQGRNVIQAELSPSLLPEIVENIENMVSGKSITW